MPDPIPAARRRAPRRGAVGTACIAGAISAAAGSAIAQQDATGPDSSVFLQAGWHGGSRSWGLGATRDWPAAWSWALAGGRLAGYWSASAEYWKYPAADDGSSSATRLAKVEAAPVLRFRGEGGRSAWFVDAGIGLTLTSRLYRSGPTRASTAFNFGDQIAVGWLFGPTRQHELAVRFEHMSNAGIKEPNPAINFYQLRYAYRFGG